MTRVGVVGAGVMGTGLTQNLTEHGHEVVLTDRSKEALDRARSEIERYERFGALLGATGPRREDMTQRVTYSTDLQELGDVEFLVENITENWELKRELYPRLDEVCPPSTVFAVNTSAIPITKVAARTGRPDRVLGMHFMNPVPMKSTVEVIKGWHTSQETIDTALALLAGVGKNGVLVNDSPGFVSNRVLMLTINEAVFLVADGVATAEQVDQIFTECFGHRMGPLATADLIGLDTILYSIDVLYENFQDSKYRPCPLLQRMVDAGLHGRKSGEGFFRYADAA
ncbi:putative 3-hydroxybutyryl-CoA dehydrogenase [Streptomyces sp. enrichment culture]|jgi:3-hydroxybutyryl-CoA dehydrogenase|uniref:3-hydroxyacyl-CoA dehydrogenase family protein n=1 Tax=Streptomyces xiamenensis TaxID=408015 RepID=UPI0036EC6A9C